MPPEARLPLTTPSGDSPLLQKIGRVALDLQGSVRHFAAYTPTRLVVFGLVALASKWVTLGFGGYMNDNRDAQYLYLYEELARSTITRFHELPFWDPYYCGGLPALGTPSARFVSPTFLITLVFGTIRADALIAFAMTIVGLEGMFRYARARGGGAAGAMLVAPVFAISGFFAKFPTYGWTHFFGFELVPWALLGMRLALRGSRRGVVLLGLSVAWMVGFGGTYAAPVTALAAGAELIEALVRRSKRPGSALHVLSMAGLALVFAVAASLVRIWPIAELLSAAPRVLGGTDGHTPDNLMLLLFGDRLGRFRGADFLVGTALMPVFVLGGLRRKAMPLVGAGFVWLWLALGYDAKPSLFAWLRLVPPYTMLRAPERSLALFGIVFVVVAALALRGLEAMGRRAPWALLLWLGCALLVAVDVAWLVKNDTLCAKERTMVETPPVVVRDFHQARGNRWLAGYYPYTSRGSLACFDDYNVAQSPDLRGDLDKEEYLKDEGAGTVERIAWSPNHVRLRVSLVRPARVYINQNWHPGWRSSDGVVVSEGGVLAVDLPAGKNDVELRFLPRSGVGGMATSLAALVVAGVALWRSRGGSRDTILPGRPFLKDLLLFASPFALSLLALVFVHQPRRPPPVLWTPVGEPVVADAPPEGAVPINATWAEGITLVAARVLTQPTRTATEKTATVELDWRIDKKPPKGLGVFLHVEGHPTFIPLDYALLSGVLLFEDAPLHKILRDVSEPIRLPWNGKPMTYDVRAGLFLARRTGERLKSIRGPGAETQDDGRIFVGSFVAP